jgi:hypothetical protein
MLDVKTAKPKCDQLKTISNIKPFVKPAGKPEVMRGKIVRIFTLLMINVNG